jgi:hypothetical protein
MQCDGADLNFAEDIEEEEEEEEDQSTHMISLLKSRFIFL